MKILVTGAAGFIGSHLCQSLKLLGYEVVAADNFSDYYSINLKRDRVNQLIRNIELVNMDISSSFEVNEFGRVSIQNLSSAEVALNAAPLFNSVSCLS